jgi:hypothetical protein
VVLVSAPLAGLSPSTTYHFRIAVTTALGTSYGADETFETMSAVPRITSIEPASGGAGGGTAVTIHGSNFVAPATVTIGSAATSVEVLSETEIKARTAATAPGSYEVVVGNAYGSSTKGPSFTYARPVVTSVEPASGSTGGGTIVTIHGSNFVSPATVTIGGAATSVEVLSETEIKARTAATTAGSYEVVVSDANGSSTKGPTFTYSPTGARYTSSFGSLGSGSGELKHPEGVALDAKGDVWVVDSGNYRVDEFSPEGNFMRAFGWGVATGAKELQTCSSSCQTGLPGSGPGQLGVEGAYKQAVGIAVAPESAGGDLWVADPGNARVTEFKPEANEVKYEREIHSSGSVTLANPLGVAVDSSGNVWVADWNGQLDEFSSSGVSLLQVTSSSPDGVAIDPLTGNVWVSEVNVQRVSEFTSSGALVETFGWGVKTGAKELQTCTANCQAGLAGSEPGQFYNPTGISVGPKGHVWVMENWNQRVQEFSPSGEYVAQFGSPGNGAGQLYGPWGLAVGSETAYFGDSGNNRVEKWAAWE